MTNESIVWMAASHTNVAPQRLLVVGRRELGGERWVGCGEWVVRDWESSVRGCRGCCVILAGGAQVVASTSGRNSVLAVC
jgi:hypothetical protein